MMKATECKMSQEQSVCNRAWSVYRQRADKRRGRGDEGRNKWANIDALGL